MLSVIPRVTMKKITKRERKERWGEEGREEEREVGRKMELK